MSHILSAEEVIKSIDRTTSKLSKEKREFKRQQALLEDTRDLRDDLMSAVRNSGMSFEDIHGMCGPHPSTLRAWDEKVIDSPRQGKMRAVGRIIGLKLKWEAE